MAYQEISKAKNSYWCTEGWTSPLELLQCPLFGSRSRKHCKCPTCLAVQTVDKTITNLGQFAIAQAELALKTVYGNPSCGKSIEDYLHFITKKQTVAHMSPKQAVPLFFKKLSKLMSRHLSSIHSKLYPTHPAIDMFLRTRCGLLLPWFLLRLGWKSDQRSAPPLWQSKLPFQAGRGKNFAWQRL